jgi:hypothetical protein
MKSILFHTKSLIVLFVAVLGFSIESNAQLKIGSTPASINPDAIFEMQTTNKGLLLPRVALTATTSPSPLTNFVQGMLVYDTVTVADITPGMYYCDGVKWIKLTATASSGNTWNLAGNAGTDSLVNFIGTTDSNPLLLKTNGNEQVRITSNGSVGIGTNTPAATLHVQGNVIIGTLISGDVATDSILLVDPQSGLIKKASLSNAGVKVLKSQETVSTRGQLLFNTPASYTDSNRISLYRNGVQISFTSRNSSLIVAEIPCEIGDEIKIIQLL